MSDPDDTGHESEPESGVEVESDGGRADSRDDRTESTASNEKEGGEEGVDELAAGWQVWSESEERIVFVYRPDVFDAREFPAACLPTIYVTHGRRSRRPGDRRPRPGEGWYVTFLLEPEVERGPEACENRAEAIAVARKLAERFARGDLDYRGLYQVPREIYLDRLDELTGRGDEESSRKE